MKISKFVFLLILPLVVLSVSLSPAYARVNESKPEGLNDKVSFCNRLTDVNQKVMSRVNSSNLTAKIDDYTNSLVQENKAMLAKLSLSRAEADSDRQKRYDSLLSQNLTEQQKQLLTEHKSSIEELIKIRRQKVDDSLIEFESKTTELISNYKQDIDEQKAKMVVSIESAYNKANEQCESNVDDESISTKYKAELESYKSVFVKNSVKNYKTSLQQIRSDRNNSIKMANDEFKKSVEKLNRNQ